MLTEKNLLQDLVRYPYFPFIFYITEETISGKALLAIEKNEIKEMGVQPIGRRIELMAKITEIIKTREKEHLHLTEVESNMEKSSVKRKITTVDKKKLGCQIQGNLLGKVSIILRIKLFVLVS